MITIKSGLVLEYLRNSAWKTVIMFGTPTCTACKKATDIVVPLLELAHTDVEFYFLDGDKFPTPADLYDIEYYPTFVYFEGGEEKRKIQSTNIKEIESALFKQTK
jgi:thiol-disulfide isomerase/thioredoxin